MSAWRVWLFSCHALNYFILTGNDNSSDCEWTRLHSSKPYFWYSGQCVWHSLCQYPTISLQGNLCLFKVNTSLYAPQIHRIWYSCSKTFSIQLIYCIALIFHRSLILRISQIWNCLQNYFIEKFDTSKLSHIEQCICEIIWAKLEKTAIHKNFDPQNISVIRYSQLETTLLHSCLSLPKLAYILYTCPPSHITNNTREFNDAIRSP